MSNKIKLTDKEQTFLDKFIDTNHIHPGSKIYWDLAKKILSKMHTEHLLGTSLVTAKAFEVAEEILFKIASVEADEFLEELLTVAPKSKSTKAMSLDLIKKDKTCSITKIRSALASSEVPLSRKELSERTGLRLQSVCGRINEMVSDGSVVIADIKWDKDSCRNVETVRLK